MKGTGNGNVPRRLGHKTTAFIIYVISMTCFAAGTGKIGLPGEVITQGMWMITFLGSLLVGGQAAIQTLVPLGMRWADAYASAKNGKPMPEPVEQEPKE